MIHVTAPRHLILPRLLGMAVLASTVAFASPDRLSAQSTESTVGVVAGWVANEQVWKPDYETESVGGLQLGGFLNAATPIPWLRIRAEFLWSQRGGRVESPPTALIEVVGDTRTDYLTVGVQPRVALGYERIELFLAAGPVMELVLRNRFGAGLAGGVQAVGTTFGAGAGVGLAGRINEALRGEVEVRVFEGLSDAYEGDFISARNRSFEVVVRVGRSLRR